MKSFFIVIFEVCWTISISCHGDPQQGSRARMCSFGMKGLTSRRWSTHWLSAHTDGPLAAGSGVTQSQILHYTLSNTHLCWDGPVATGITHSVTDPLRLFSTTDKNRPNPQLMEEQWLLVISGWLLSGHRCQRKVRIVVRLCLLTAWMLVSSEGGSCGVFCEVVVGGWYMDGCVNMCH